MSNYINSLNSQYQNSYFHTKMTSIDRVTNTSTQYNNTPLVYGSKSSNGNSYVNSDSISYLSKIQAGAKALSASLKDMTNASTFQKMSAVSSNNEALAVQSSSVPTDKFKATIMDIEQIAAGQLNKGTALNASDMYTGELGKQRFEIEIDGKKTQLEVEVKVGDTNKAVQQKMASAVNAANVGVTASVSSTNGISSLSIEANQTGVANKKSSFSIRDWSGSLVSKTGAAAVEREAQDAVYTINGESRTSATNSVDLGEGVKVTLKKATDEPVTVSVQEDKTHAANKLNDIVKNYNSLLSTAKTSTNGNARLENDLVTTAKSYLSSLEQFGITMSKDGSLNVDSKKLNAAAEDGSLEKYFSSYENANYGFADRLSKITQNVERNPSYYINQTSSKSTESFDFTNPSFDNLLSLTKSNNFNMSRYYSYENTYSLIGMMFNLYV